MREDGYWGTMVGAGGGEGARFVQRAMGATRSHSILPSYDSASAWAPGVPWHFGSSSFCAIADTVVVPVCFWTFLALTLVQVQCQGLDLGLVLPPEARPLPPLLLHVPHPLPRPPLHLLRPLQQQHLLLHLHLHLHLPRPSPLLPPPWPTRTLQCLHLHLPPLPPLRQRALKLRLLSDPAAPQGLHRSPSG